MERLSILIWREKRLAETEAELFKHRHKNAQELAFADFLKALPLSDQHLIGRYQGMIGRQIRDMLKNLREEQDLRLKAIQAPSKDEG